MAKTLQFRRGTTAELDAITGAEGELFVDLDTNSIRVHDGVTSGGIALATQTYVDNNVFDGDYNSLTNKPDLTVFDNVDTFAAFGSFPASGDNYKIYIAEDTGFTYRWSGSGYVQLTDQTAVWGSISGTLSNQTDLQNALDTKQNNLVSGTNIKTVNGTTLLGSGDLTISGGGSADLSEVAEDILPLFTEIYDIGSIDKRWYDVFVSNSVDIAGATIQGSEAGLVTGTILADDLLISENMITPDDSTARQYLGDKGILIVDGNIDAQGDWIRVPVVETAEGEFSSVWSSGGNLITARYRHAGAGTQDAALAFGGRFDSINIVSSTEEYDGTSWSSGGNLITARDSHAGAGTQDAALAFGGRDGSSNILSSTEEYDGTSWSSGGNLITARYSHAGAGTQTAALAFGGFGGAYSSTEEYDGTSWSSGGNLITARTDHAGAGTQDAALAFGGASDKDILSSTEEYDGTSWSSDGNLITARYNHAGAGTQDAALAFGGRFGGASSTEEYDGTSWSSGGNLITARYSHAGAGTQTAALAFGGSDDSFNILSSTEEYNKTPITETVTPPELGEEGMIRYNRDIGDYEKYKNGAWVKWGSAEVVETIDGAIPSTDGQIGDIRFNKDTGKFEGYNGTAWVALSQ